MLCSSLIGKLTLILIVFVLWRDILSRFLIIDCLFLAVLGLFAMLDFEIARCINYPNCLMFLRSLLFAIGLIYIGRYLSCNHQRLKITTISRLSSDIASSQRVAHLPLLLWRQPHDHILVLLLMISINREALYSPLSWFPRTSSEGSEEGPFLDYHWKKQPVLKTS